jgi:hypothetical protein
MKRFLVAAALIAGCGSNGNNNDMGGGGNDLSMNVDGGGGDAFMTTGAIGAGCQASSDCKEGPAPVCWIKHIENKLGYLATPGGYCSSTCNADTDCGAKGHCQEFTDIGKRCIAACTSDGECRGKGYACFMNLGCFPDGNLDCDPAAAGGLCSYRGGPMATGGCVRQAYGTGTRGTCFELCGVGVNTCTPDNGTARHCIVDDETHMLDGTPTTDTWKGPVCFDAIDTTTNPPLIADGADCLYSPVGGKQDHYPDVCVAGEECWVKQFDANADQKCHKLCYQGGAMPDLGFMASDGGMFATGCTTGTCTDTFKLFGTMWPIGLCI